MHLCTSKTWPTTCSDILIGHRDGNFLRPSNSLISSDNLFRLTLRAGRARIDEVSRANGHPSRRGASRSEFCRWRRSLWTAGIWPESSPIPSELYDELVRVRNVELAHYSGVCRACPHCRQPIAGGKHISTPEQLNSPSPWSSSVACSTGRGCPQWRYCWR